MAAGVLITGASGLLGSWTVRHLEAAGLGTVPVGSRARDLLAPGAAEALLDALRPERVVHLAWCASGTVGYRHSADNRRWVGATVELWRACREARIPFWATGSVVDETHDPADEYALAKSALREELADEISSGDLGWLRPFYVFDESTRRPAVVANALAAKDQGRSVELRTPNDTHDFVHASDVGNAIAFAVRHHLTGEIPIGSGKARRVMDLVTCLGASWRPTEVADGDRMTHTTTVADTHRLTGIGWAATNTEEFFSHG